MSVGWFRASLWWCEPIEVGEEEGTATALVLSPRGHSPSFLQPCFKTMDDEHEADSRGGSALWLKSFSNCQLWPCPVIIFPPGAWRASERKKEVKHELNESNDLSGFACPEPM